MNISCTNLIKNYGTQSALDSLCLHAEFSHTLALIGPSGGGKSTLMRVLAGLLIPDAGRVEVDGRAMVFEESYLHRYRLRAGIVFQGYNLFPHLSAFDNVLLPLRVVHRFEDAGDRAHAALHRFRLADHASKKPAELSGGQRQRVAIARALAANPDYLFMDEPTSALDPEMTAEVLDVIAGLREQGQPLVLVTHEMGFARQTADVVAFVCEGRALECQPAADFFANPASAAAQRFLQRILKY
jgi:polar amino acid transport system ATP-binding protein